jgi:hypothetical protein
MIILWWEFRQINATDYDRRERARYLLSVRPDSGKYLLKAMTDEDAGVRIWAADALRKRKQKDAVPTLINALHDHNPAVQSKAALALGAIGDPEASDALVRLGTMDAMLALACLGDHRSMPPLLRTLEMHGDPLRIPYEILEALVGVLREPAAISPVIEFLLRHNAWYGRDDDALRSRDIVCDILRKAPRSALHRVLWDKLRATDTSHSHRSRTQMLLWQTGWHPENETERAVCTVMEQANPDKLNLSGLGHTGPATMKMLITAMDWEGCGEIAARILVEIQPSEAVVAFGEKIAHSACSSGREVAAQALLRLLDGSFPTPKGRLRWDATAIRNRLDGKQTAGLISSLMAAAKHQDATMRQSAAKALELLGPPEGGIPRVPVSPQ